MVLDELLSNGTRTFIKFSCKHTYGNTKDTSDIDTVMLPESLILYRYKGIDKILRYLIIVNVNSVEINLREFRIYRSVRVINSTLKALRLYAYLIDIRGIIKNSLHHSEACSGGYYYEKYKCYKYKLKKIYKKLS